MHKILLGIKEVLCMKGQTIERKREDTEVSLRFISGLLHYKICVAKLTSTVIL